MVTKKMDGSEKKPLKRMLTRKIYEWSIHSTSHGIPRLAESKNVFVKIMWAMFLIVSIGICSFMVAQSVSNYLEFDVTTKIREIPLDEIEFPAVSICNLNPFVTSQANRFLRNFLADPINFKLSQYFVNATEQELKTLRPTNKSEINLNWLQYITGHSKFNDTLRRSFSYWPDYFFDCHFRLVPCNPSQVLHHFYHLKYGNCFRFNGNVKDKHGNVLPPAKIVRDCEGFGISMFIGPSDLFFTYANQPQYTGIKLFITDRDVIPFAQRGVFIKPGTSALIQVSRTDAHTSSKPYSNCQEANEIKTELANEMRRIGMRYMRRDCMKICEQKHIIDRYECYSLKYPRIFDARPCTTPIDLQFNMTDCLYQCPHECHSTSYNMRISYGEYPSKRRMFSLASQDKSGLYTWAFQVNESNQSLSKSEFNSLKLARASLVKVFIYFKNIKYTKISEAPLTSFLGLIANIGGTLGLFIGISLLSFVELIELSLDVATIIWINFKTRN